MFPGKRRVTAQSFPFTAPACGALPGGLGEGTAGQGQGRSREPSDGPGHEIQVSSWLLQEKRPSPETAVTFHTEPTASLSPSHKQRTWGLGLGVGPGDRAWGSGWLHQSQYRVLTQVA